MRCRITVLVVAAIAALAASCAKPPLEGTAPAFRATKDEVSLEPGAPSPVRFVTAEAEQGAPLPLPPVVARVTTLDPLTAPSFAPLDGRVVDVRVRLGDHVERGDKLLAGPPADRAPHLAPLDRGRLAIQTKQAIVERTRQLVEARAGSKNDLLVAESELAEAKLAAQEAAAKLAALSVKQVGNTSYWVVANRSGTVVQLDAVPGKQVGPDKDKPVATIADLDEVLVLGDVAQKNAMSLASGMKAEVRFPGSTAAPIEGVVESVSEVIDPERQTVPVRVRVKNRGRALRPNAYVDLTFAPPADAKVVRVPAESVVSDGAASVVFVETKAGVFRRRPVELGRQTKEKVEIASGLSAGERVVTTGALLLLNALDVEG